MFEYHHLDAIYPETGWKIHLSCALEDFARLHAFIRQTSLLRDVSWKICSDEAEFFLMNSQGTPRENAGKICTIYPATWEQALRLIRALLPELKSFHGPKILTDYRVVDSIIHIRYGAFVMHYRINESGEAELAYKDPLSHELFPDRRELIPDPAKNPLPEEFREVRTEETHAFPYSVTKAFKHSASGGVYFAQKEGVPYILKEGRPYAGYDDLKRDAVERLRHEAAIVDQLADMDGIERHIESFSYQDNYYSVFSYEGSFTLLSAIIGKSLAEFYGINADAISRRRFLDYMESSMNSLRHIVGQAHNRGVLVGDIQPENIMVGDDGSLTLIDFGSAAFFKRGERASVARALATDSSQTGDDGREVDDVELRHLYSVFLDPMSMHYMHPEPFEAYLTSSLFSDEKENVSRLLGWLGEGEEERDYDGFSHRGLLSRTFRELCRTWKNFTHVTFTPDSAFLSGVFGTVCVLCSLLRESSYREAAEISQGEDFLRMVKTQLGLCLVAVDRALLGKSLGLGIDDGIIGVLAASELIGDTDLEERALAYLQWIIDSHCVTDSGALAKALLVLSHFLLENASPEHREQVRSICDQIVRQLTWDNLGDDSWSILRYALSSYELSHAVSDDATEYICTAMSRVLSELVITPEMGTARKRPGQFNPYLNLGSAGALSLSNRLRLNIPGRLRLNIPGLSEKLAAFTKEWKVDPYYGFDAFWYGRSGILWAKRGLHLLNQDEFDQQLRYIVARLEISASFVCTPSGANRWFSIGYGIMGPSLLLLQEEIPALR